MADNSRFLRNVILKTALLFALANAAFAAGNPLPALGGLSIYNVLVPGRPRLPFGAQPDLAYNMSLFNLEAMFASHEVSAVPASDREYRVLIIGDSSVWGFLLKPEDTLSAQLNAGGLQADGKQLRFFNLGYPTMSLAKDLLMLRYGMRYQPDLILWCITQESMPREKQLSSPIVQRNPEDMRALISDFGLDLDPRDPAFVDPDYWGRTVFGRRRDLADLLRLQLYGLPWAATGVDQYYPETYDHPQKDLDADWTFHDRLPPRLDPESLAFDVLDAGRALAGEIPLIVVNEPIYISPGRNSHIRYNFFYPRWAYDQYRLELGAWCRENPDVACLDAWDIVPAEEFTNSAIHVTPAGEALLAEQVAAAIRGLIHAD